MALTRITKGVIKPNENYDTHDINSTGIITATGANITGNMTVGGVLTYEDVTSIDSVGLITARNGIDCNGDLDVDGHTNLDNVSIAGVTTAFRIRLEDNRYLQIGNSQDLQLYHDGTNSYINEGGTGSLFIAGSALRMQSNDNRLNDVNGNVIIKTDATSAYLYYEGSNRLNTTSVGINIPKDLDVDGHTNLDNVSVAGVTTFAGAITAPDIITAGALLHEGDTDTLVHFSAANTIQLKTGGTSKLLVNNFGLSLENGDLNTNGSRIIVGDSSGASDDRIVLGNTNDLQLYHNASDSYIENATGVLKILGDDIQLGEGNDTVGIGTDNAGAKLDVFGSLQVKDSAGLQNFYISDSGFKFNQTVSNWSNMTYTSSPVLGWDYKNGPGDMFYVGSGGNTAMASQMALVVSDGHGVKIGKSGYDGTDYDISSSDEYLRITTTGQIGIGTATIRNNRAMQFTGASNSLFLITGNAPSICLNRDPDDSSDSDRSFFGVSSVSNGFANGTAAGDTVIRGNSSGKLHFATGTSVRMSIASGGDTTLSVNVNIGGDLSIADSLVHYGDNDTKIRFPTTDTITFETAGSERLRIHSSGKVGINTTSDSMDGVTGNLNIANTNFNNHTVINLSRNTTSDRPHIRFQDSNGNVGYIGTYDSDLTISSGNDLIFRASSTDKLRITSGGNVGIGEDNPTAKLLIRDDYDTETIILKLRNYKSGVNTKPSLRFEAVTSSGQGANSTIQGLAGTDAGGAANANDSGMKFNVAYGGAGTAREAFSLKRDGNIHFPNGQGINFGATAGGNASSGIFHDYEEGLWTPTVVAGIDGGAVFSIVRGWYIKVGDLVQISFFVRFVNSATGSTGNGNHFKMGGLPYSAANLSPAYSSGGVVTYTNCYFNNSNTIVFNIYNNTTQMEFHSARASAATLSGASNNRDIYAFGTYRSA